MPYRKALDEEHLRIDSSVSLILAKNKGSGRRSGWFIRQARQEWVNLAFSEDIEFAPTPGLKHNGNLRHISSPPPPPPRQMTK